VWVANVLVLFTLICGGALSLFLIKEEWRMFGEAKRQIRELPPEVRRQNIRNMILAWVGILVAAGLIFGVYGWGAHQWSSKSGAALAIGVFVLVMGGGLTVGVIRSVRDLNREQSSTDADAVPMERGPRHVRTLDSAGVSVLSPSEAALCDEVDQV
jgi:hypothetical protein